MRSSLWALFRFPDLLDLDALLRREPFGMDENRLTKRLREPV